MTDVTNLIGFGANRIFGPFGVDQTPTMSGYTSGIITVSASDDAGDLAWKAFDKNGSTYWGTASGLPAWLQVDFGVSVVIFGYTLQARTGGNEVSAPGTFTLQGSDDGTNFTIIDSKTGLTYTSGEKKTFAIPAPMAFRYYRLNVTDTAFHAQTTCAEMTLTN